MAPLRPALLALIHGYRLLISPVLPGACRFEPTCSTYGLEAIRRFGALAGGWLTLRRLVRCHPWGGAGYDPVPEVPPPVSALVRRTAPATSAGCDEATAGPGVAR